ncbi:DUF3267 domain-containing protein [Pyrococcus abyssi]|uniref:Membrane-associated metallopeptidase n=1 Tax=Pyrococcus abyssi (strain GE5 / Orsay) TaxID=272844 RepID=Q9V078_PYRAB|nr:DUF3267 domain-containing protein [Pyrococcus abyssi]CAB49827.1 Hypothetical protein PAB1753 [Pyrococcus abyssi GE5]CCE70321.1 TPA: hypothetical protein PAB1753 [Pyrococcus abyssi GE5]
MNKLDLKEYKWDLLSLYFILFALSAKVATLIVGEVGVEIKSMFEFAKYIILPLLLVIILHEGMHVLVLKLLGAEIKVGISSITKLDVSPYIATPSKIRARDYVKVSLAPVVLSIIFLALAKIYSSFFWGFAFLLNTAGLSGDILVALSLAKMPREALVWDEGTVMVSSHEFPRPYPKLVSYILRGIIAVFLIILIANTKFVVVRD